MPTQPPENLENNIPFSPTFYCSLLKKFYLPRNLTALKISK
jgi:hypothetical protein